MNYTISQEGINLIKSFEGCRLNAYQDSVGVWTIGYGHTLGVCTGMIITEEQAEKFLRADLQNSERVVNRMVTCRINQNQYDALVSFAFNVGVGNMKSSTLLKKLNQNDTVGAAAEFDKWIYAGGKMLKGLVRRREAEKQLFLKDIVRNSIPVAGDKIIVEFQTWLNKYYASELVVDGFFGYNTKKAVIKSYQTLLGVTADGVFGLESKASVVTLRLGYIGNAVYIMQGMLYCLGFYQNKIDGIFGTSTEKAVKEFQLSKGIVVDGVAGENTMYVLYN